MDIVQEVLRKEQETLGKFKPIAVEKHLEVENDLGLLLCSDSNELDEAQLRYVFMKSRFVAVYFTSLSQVEPGRILAAVDPR